MLYFIFKTIERNADLIKNKTKKTFLSEQGARDLTEKMHCEFFVAINGSKDRQPWAQRALWRPGEQSVLCFSECGPALSVPVVAFLALCPMPSLRNSVLPCVLQGLTVYLQTDYVPADRAAAQV